MVDTTDRQTDRQTDADGQTETDRQDYLRLTSIARSFLSTAFEVQWLIQTKVVLQTDRDRDRLQTRISRMDKTDLGASVDVTLKTFRQYFTPLLYPRTHPFRLSTLDTMMHEADARG